MNQTKTGGGRAMDSHRHSMLTVKEIAALLNVSERHVWRLRSSARFPEPVKIGRAVRWTRRSVMQYIENGGTNNVK